jgi:gamma-glutamyltranspeptidase/glutathione hydrolase
MAQVKLCTALITAAFLLSACNPSVEQQAGHPAEAQTEPTTRTAAVAIPDSYGAQISEDILRAGGNAVDAAVAAGFSLAVTFIDAGNIGGGGFMLIHIDGETAFLDYRETAPLAAHKDMYLDENGDVIYQASLIGGQAAGVPGTVA